MSPARSSRGRFNSVPRASVSLFSPTNCTGIGQLVPCLHVVLPSEALAVTLLRLCYVRE